MRGPACRLAQAPVGRHLPGSSRHSETCLECQADAARTRRLQKDLRKLAIHVERAPHGFGPRVEHAVDVATAAKLSASQPDCGVARQVATASAVAATAAGAAAVMLWRRSQGAA